MAKYICTVCGFVYDEAGCKHRCTDAAMDYFKSDRGQPHHPGGKEDDQLSGDQDHCDQRIEGKQDAA